jgi:hypothetical protein
VVPGYKGFVPGVRSSSLYGKSYTEQSRDVMKSENLDKPGVLATTGFNASRLNRQDQSLHAISNKYGGQTLMATSPAIHDKQPFTTQIRTTF